MIKASEGGGGKGIRKAKNDEEFSNGFRQVNIFCCCSINYDVNFTKHMLLISLFSRITDILTLYGFHIYFVVHFMRISQISDSFSDILFSSQVEAEVPGSPIFIMKCMQR